MAIVAAYDPPSTSTRSAATRPRHPDDLILALPGDEVTSDPRHVIVVHPSVTLRTLISRTLGGQGYSVHTCATAAQALDVMERQGAALLIVDMELDEMSGLELAERIRGEHSSAHIPVILLVRHGQTADSHRLAHAGVNETLIKPFEQQQLLGRVRAHLSGPEDADRKARDLPDSELPKGEALEHWLQVHLRERVGDALEPLIQRAVKETLLGLLERPESDAGRRLLSTLVEAVREETREVLKREPTAVLKPALEGTLRPAILKAVPELAEDMIREEIRRLTEEGGG